MAREFVVPHSIVRTIWGDPDRVLLIFAGSAAEFALNRAVDWLFVTGNLPNDPLGRLFSTVHYSQRILFASVEEAQSTLESISTIHSAVERKRGERIPDWAHRDVLYMLIDQSERAHRLLAGPLTRAQQNELYDTFLQIGHGLHIPGLPATYSDWQRDRQIHLQRDLEFSALTERLYRQYRLHLGTWRYWLLLEIQALLVPDRVRDMLGLRPSRRVVGPSIKLYSLVRHLGFQPLAQRALVPRQYWDDVQKLNSARAAV